MTLIAGLSDVCGGFCLFGDLLLTTDTISVPDLRYPTKPSQFSGENNAPIDSSPLSLVQKIELFTNDIIAGFAGDLTNIRTLARYLRDNVIKGTDITVDKLRQAISDYVNLHEEEAMPHMVLFQAEPGVPFITCHTLGATTTEIDQVGRFVCVGSGQDDFLKFMSDNAAGRVKTIISGSVVPADRVPLVGATLMLEFMDAVMVNQRRNGWGLKNAWGGGCELYYRQPDGFVRMDNILFQSLVCRKTPSGYEFQEKSKTLQQYFDDELIIKTCHPTSNGVETHIIKGLNGNKKLFHKEDYLDQEFDQPIHTMTNIRDVNTKQTWQLGQVNLNGDRNAFLGDPKSSSWISYNTDFLASEIAKTAK